MMLGGGVSGRPLLSSPMLLPVRVRLSIIRSINANAIDDGHSFPQHPPYPHTNKQAGPVRWKHGPKPKQAAKKRFRLLKGGDIARCVPCV
jgi:hypothetical protein